MQNRQLTHFLEGEPLSPTRSLSCWDSASAYWLSSSSLLSLGTSAGSAHHLLLQMLRRIELCKLHTDDTLLQSCEPSSFIQLLDSTRDKVVALQLTEGQKAINHPIAPPCRYNTLPCSLSALKADPIGHRVGESTPPSISLPMKVISPEPIWSPNQASTQVKKG